MRSTVWVVCVAGLVACGAQGDAPNMVRPGIDVLLSDSIHLVAGRRVGLLTNQTGIDANGITDLERLLDANVQVSAIFSPEHGYRGLLDQEMITDTTETLTGIRIFSLYGETRIPTPEMLEGVDVIVVDLHDIGARPYTYISTVLGVAETAARAGLTLVVLDRPNPLDGVHVQGPVRDSQAFHGFNGLLAVPQRHGLTLGEMTLLGNTERGIGADIVVVPMSGWKREQWFDQSGLPWVRPSPSMPDLESATHYPGLVMFEATNLSVGRGTDRAFQVVGAPWLDPEALIAKMGPKRGVSLEADNVTPVEPPDQKYADRGIPVVRLRVTDRAVYDPVVTGVELLAAIHALHADSLAVSARRLHQLIGASDLWPTIVAGGDLDEMFARWRTEVDAFRIRIASHYLYH